MSFIQNIVCSCHELRDEFREFKTKALHLLGEIKTQMATNQQSTDARLSRIEASSAKILTDVGVIATEVNDINSENQTEIDALKAERDSLKQQLADSGVNFDAFDAVLGRLEDNTGKLDDLSASLKNAAKAPGNGTDGPAPPVTSGGVGTGSPVVPEDGQPVDGGVVANTPENERDPLTGAGPGVPPESTTVDNPTGSSGISPAGSAEVPPSEGGSQIPEQQ